MEATPVATLTKHFAPVEDPRVDRGKEHKLIDIVVIAICGVICGADGWTGIERFGHAKLEWLQQYLDLPNGIPSHDTFGRVFAQLDPEQFQESFLNWVNAVYKVTDGQVIAVDGKTIRRSHDSVLGKDAIQMVNAWATENELMLAQTDVETDSNEITAIPELLDKLALSGCLVTIDAAGCQHEIAQHVVDQGGDYLLTVKRNQKKLYDAIDRLFTVLPDWGYNVTDDHHKTVDSGHGRIETRECWTVSDPTYLDYVQERSSVWAHLSTIVKVRATRSVDGEISVETRYFIASATDDAETMLDSVRLHWHVENAGHWVLDIAFREDESRIRQGNAAQNFAVLRQMALNLLKTEESETVGIKNKRLKAAWDEDYLVKVLTGN